MGGLFVILWVLWGDLQVLVSLISTKLILVRSRKWQSHAEDSAQYRNTPISKNFSMGVNFISIILLYLLQCNILIIKLFRYMELSFNILFSLDPSYIFMFVLS
jgi:hypothetical protein